MGLIKITETGRLASHIYMHMTVKFTRVYPKFHVLF